MRARPIIAALAIAAGVGLAACGSDDAAVSHGSGGKSGSGGSAGKAGDSGVSDASGGVATGGGSGTGGVSDGGADAAQNFLADYFVSPDGDDSWSGTLAEPNSASSDGPFKTLEAAQAAVRATPRAGRTTPIVVGVRAGTYSLASTWTFTSADSGSAEVPVVYQAFPGESPVISGGKVLGGWTAASGGVWKTTVPTGSKFEQLWVNGERRYRPRANGGSYLRIGTPSTVSSFHYLGAGDLNPSWHDLGAIELIVFEAWTVSRQRLKSIVASTQTANTTPFSSNSTFHGYIANHRYLVDNVKEALNKPSEWYLDRASGELSYVAKPGEDPSSNAEVVMPVLSGLVSATGLAYTTFRGLTFSHTNWTVPDTGYAAGQALWDIPAALTFTDAAHVEIDACRITHVGNTGIEFQGSGGWAPSASQAFSNEIVNSELSDLGANGIRIGKKPGSYTETTTAQGVHVANNVLAGGGRFMHSGIGIVVGDAHHVTIEHNEVYDFYQTGISVGFSFASQPSNGTQASYPASLTHDDVVQHNLVHHIGRGATSDMGGVYLLTCDNTGNVVANNVIHDVVHDPGAGAGFATGYGGNGIYFDQGTSRVVTENNLVVRVSGNAFQQNEGRASVVRNNIFAFARASTYEHTFWEPSGLWATFERNVVFYDHGSVQGGNWVCPSGGDCRKWVDFHGNLYFNAAGSVSFKTTSPAAAFDLAGWQTTESEELGSKIANPLFVDPKPPKDDFSFQTGSPATSVGFVAFDPKQAGRTSTSLVPASVPDAVPLQEPADPATFY